MLNGRANWCKDRQSEPRLIIQAQQEMNTTHKLLLLFLIICTGCITRQSILKTPMPKTYDEWCVQELKEENQIMVLGEVHQPGIYKLRKAPTLGKAIVAAGGYGDLPVVRRIHVLRESTKAYYDLRPYSKPILATNELLCGDIVIVPHNMFLPSANNPVKMPANWIKAKEYYGRKAQP